MAFRFRQFTLEDRQSTMRIGTDAMLLGSWANPGVAKKILDIGTGSGVLSLMMAQKSEAMIEAIDIDHSSVLQARNNFLHSPWHSRLTAIHDSLQSFSCQKNADYDFIISNPPYFSNSLKSLSLRTNQTRHNDCLSINELALIVSHLLATDGSFALVIPSEAAEKSQMICAEHGLYPARRLVVYPKTDSLPKRVLTEFTKIKILYPENTELTILDSAGKFTPEYFSLTEYFHNF